MKKIALSFLSFALCIGSFAQSFQGQIKYKIEMKGENAALMSMMSPNGLEISISGNNSLIKMKGGMVPTGDIISKEDGNTYMVMHNKKTAFLMPKEDKETDDAADMKPTVEEKGTETVNGYKCTKYLVKFPKKDNNEVYQYMWCTKDIKVATPKGAGKSAAYFIEEIDGFPVKIDQYIKATMQGQTINMNQELTLESISEEKPADELFEIPKKYKIEPFSEEALLKSLGQ